MNFALYCSILPHICILYNIILMFYDVSGDFLNNLLSSNFNYVWQKRHLLVFLNITGATELQKRQGRGPRFRNFEMDKMS
jgi:hypothetical protein